MQNEDEILDLHEEPCDHQNAFLLRHHGFARQYFQRLLPELATPRGAIVYAGGTRQDRSRASARKVFDFPAFLREQEQTAAGK